VNTATGIFEMAMLTWKKITGANSGTKKIKFTWKVPIQPEKLDGHDGLFW
jgi:hypothetical protein